MISKILNAKPDAVYYSGYYAEGAPFDQQLVAKGYTGTLRRPRRREGRPVHQAGRRRVAATRTSPAPASRVSSSRLRDGLQGAGQRRARHLLASRATTPRRSCSRASTRASTTRADLLDWVKSYDKDGLSKHYKWDSTGELQAPAVYGYKVEDGKIVPIGAIGIATSRMPRASGPAASVRSTRSQPAGSTVDPALHLRMPECSTPSSSTARPRQFLDQLRRRRARPELLERHLRRPHLRRHLRPGRPRLHARLRRAEPDQLRPLRGVHRRRLRRRLHPHRAGLRPVARRPWPWRHHRRPAPGAASSA